MCCYPPLSACRIPQTCVSLQFPNIGFVAYRDARNESFAIFEGLFCEQQTSSERLGIRQAHLHLGRSGLLFRSRHRNVSCTEVFRSPHALTIQILLSTFTFYLISVFALQFIHYNFFHLPSLHLYSITSLCIRFFYPSTTPLPQHEKRTHNK